MSDNLEQKMNIVAVLHPDETKRQDVVEALDDQRVFSAETYDPQWPALDIAVVHCGVAHWTDVVSQMGRSNPGLRTVLIASDLEEACRGVNRASMDRLVCREQDVAAAVRDLQTSPLSEAQRLEREVRTRTAVLQQVKSQWEQSFDAVQDPMAVLDGNYRLIRVNRAYARHMGRDIVDVPGRLCYELRAYSRFTYPTGAGGTCEACPVARSQRDGAHTQSTIEDDKGRRWVVSAYPVDIPDMPGSLVVHYRDVTEEVQRLAKMAKADKMSAVGRLAGAVAHELNSPMTSIMVFSEALARKTAQGSELYQHATEISESAHRCRRLIQGLLRFARRPRSRERASVSLPMVIDEIRPLVQHRMDVARVKLELDLPEDLQPVRGHVADVEHVLVDLIANALEACSAGDAIHISGTNVAEQNQVRLVVADTGRGMPPEVLKAAFDPFFTTKPGGQAAGLGLTTCEAMVTEMGGTMGLESTPGEGTRAWVRLPAFAQE